MALMRVQHARVQHPQPFQEEVWIWEEVEEGANNTSIILLQLHIQGKGELMCGLRLARWLPGTLLNLLRHVAT